MKNGQKDGSLSDFDEGEIISKCTEVKSRDLRKEILLLCNIEDVKYHSLWWSVAEPQERIQRNTSQNLGEMAHDRSTDSLVRFVRVSSRPRSA